LPRIHDAQGARGGAAACPKREKRGFAGLIRGSGIFSTVIKIILRMLGRKKIVEMCDQNAYDLLAKGE
jgi:hypothetical protein